jgi:gas vesicle protein
MYDATEYQESLKQYTDKYSQVSSQAWQLNSQFLDGYLKRQSNFVSDLAEAGTEYFKQLGQGDYYSNLQEFSSSFNEDLKNRYSELNDENLAAYQAHQERLEEVYESLADQNDLSQGSAVKPKAKSKSKAKAKSAA